MIERNSNKRTTMNIKEIVSMKVIDPEMMAEIMRVSDEWFQICQSYGVEIKIIEAVRSSQRQAELWAQGRTTAGRKVTWVKHSKHEDGMALDFGLFEGGRYLDDLVPAVTERVYRKLAEVTNPEILKWGGEFHDYAHFEKRTSAQKA